MIDFLHFFCISDNFQKQNSINFKSGMDLACKFVGFTLKPPAPNLPLDLIHLEQLEKGKTLKNLRALWSLLALRESLAKSTTPVVIRNFFNQIIKPPLRTFFRTGNRRNSHCRKQNGSELIGKSINEQNFEEQTTTLNFVLWRDLDFEQA